MSMIKNISLIAWKEFIEIRRSILKLSIVMLLPLLTIYFVGVNQGTSGAFSPEFNILLTQSFGGLFSLILLKDSIMREKNQKTLEVLLISRISITEVIVGKILPILIVGTFAQIFQSMIMIVVLTYSNSSLTNLFSIKSFIFIIVINYIMSAICLLISIVINDEKASDIGAIGGAYVVGIMLLLLAMNLHAFSNFGVFLVLLTCNLIISLLSTKVCAKILTNSMLYIKI